jgi:6-phosphogluconolactonase
LAVRRDIVVCADRERLAEAVAGRVAQLLAAAIAARGRAVIALAGGSTPRDVHRALVERHARRVDWSRVVFCFGDERLVPQSDPRGNARMARDTLLRPIGADWRAVYPVPTGVDEPFDVAFRYEETLRHLFAESAASGEPTFDVVLLGMGDDGHTASLFPGDVDGLAETSRWVRDATAPEGAPSPERITLTLPAIAAARRAVFVVAGQSKHAAVRTVFAPTTGVGEADDVSAAPLPAARVRAAMGVEWWLDDAAWRGAAEPR